MKTSLEEITSIKKKVTVEIESKEVDSKLREAYRELGKQVKIPGFRPGKVPFGLLERRFGAQVAEDVTRDLINETLPGALDEVKTFPIGPPLLEKETLKKGEAFTYSAVMEIRPEFTVEDYKGIELEKERSAVGDDEVQARLEQIRGSHGKLTSIDEDRPVQAEDHVLLDYEGFEGDAPMDGIKSTNFLLKVGSNDFHQVFEESLLGMRKEETKEISVDFDDSFYHSALAGKSVRFKVKVLDIKSMDLPDLDDEFAAKLGADFKGIDDLKEKIRESMIQDEEKKFDRELKQRLIEKITGSVDFELPQVLVDSELDYAVDNVKQNFMRSGSSLEKAGLSEEKIREDFTPASEKRARELLVLGQIARQEDLSVSDEDLQKGYEELAVSTGQPSETIKKYYEARNLVESLKEKILEEKTLNYLIEAANINEVEKGTLSIGESSENDKESE